MSPPLSSPYHFLGLWRNPFGELTREERVQLAVVDVEPWLDFLAEDSNHVLQFVGDCGFGKSTRLLALQHALQQTHQREVPYVYFPEVEPIWRRKLNPGSCSTPDLHWPELPSSRPAVLDEMQRCRKHQVKRLLQSPGPLILGSHVDYTSLLERHGFRVLSVDVEAASTGQLIQTALNRRIEASRVEVVCVPSFRCPTLPEKTVTLLSDKHSANLRAIENHLYLEIQDCIQGKKLWQPAT